MEGDSRKQDNPSRQTTGATRCSARGSPEVCHQNSQTPLTHLPSRSAAGALSSGSTGGDCFVPAMGNFSIQYNFTSASIAVQVLETMTPEPSWSKEVTLPAVFLGSMVGMLTMGRLGDVIGLAPAMRTTLMLTVLGALVPAAAAGSPDATYALVCLGRLLLGVGVGGIFPLSAVSSAHGGGGHSAASRSGRAARAFFWQSVGQVVPYLVAMGLLKLFPASPQLQFRLLFALGSLPAGVVWFASLRGSSSNTRNPQSAALLHSAQEGAANLIGRQPPAVFKTLAGTASAWFLFDVSFYGIVVFTPGVLEAICLSGSKVDGKCEQSLYQTSMQSMVVLLVGIPGVLLAIAQMGQMGSKRLNVYGFLLLAAVFAAMAVVWHVDPNQVTALFALYCLLQFLLNWGPNVGTYVLPAVCFPADVRSTCHGISATGGKFGALVGSLLFQPISQSALGVPGVLLIQATACLLGALSSQVLLKHDWEYDDVDTSRPSSRAA